MIIEKLNIQPWRLDIEVRQISPLSDAETYEFTGRIVDENGHIAVTNKPTIFRKVCSISRSLLRSSTFDARKEAFMDTMEEIDRQVDFVYNESDKLIAQLEELL